MYMPLLTSDSTTLKTIAQSIPSTSNPGTIIVTRSTIKALITKLKSPRVSIFIGSVKRTMNGLINVLTTDNNTATTTAVKKPSTVTAGNT